MKNYDVDTVKAVLDVVEKKMFDLRYHSNTTQFTTGEFNEIIRELKILIMNLVWEIRKTDDALIQVSINNLIHNDDREGGSMYVPSHRDNYGDILEYFARAIVNGFQNAEFKCPPSSDAINSVELTLVVNGEEEVSKTVGEAMQFWKDKENTDEIIRR